MAAEEEEVLIDPLFIDLDTTCFICNAEFLDPEDLTIHLTQEHVDEDLEVPPYWCSCQFCSAVFTNTGDYVTHITNKHLASIRCCFYCSRAFTDYEQLDRHQSKHPIYKMKMIYSCSQCNKVFNEIYDLKQHEFMKHSKVKEGVFLNSCYSLLSAVLNTNAVKFLHSLGTDALYLCIKCSYNSYDVITYIKHLQTGNCTSFVCDTCSNVYKHKTSLRKHLQNHKECWTDATDEELEKKCEECYKMIKVANFKSHCMNCNVIKCSICKIIFNSIRELSDHQTKKHPAAVKIKLCMLCNRKFVGSGALYNHINLVHEKDLDLYTYKCTQCECEKYFKHPKDLFAHYFSTHRDLQPFFCLTCDKSYKMRKSLTLHIKLQHKGEGIVKFNGNYHVSFTATK